MACGGSEVAPFEPTAGGGFGTFQHGGKVRNLKLWAQSAEQVGASGFFCD